MRAKEGGPLRFVTSHSRFALASTMRKTKRLRRRLPIWVYTIFPYDYRARLAYVMTSRQIVSCKLTLDISATHVHVVSENCARVDGRKSCMTYASRAR